MEFKESIHNITGSHGSHLERILVTRSIAFSLVDFLGWRLVMEREFRKRKRDMSFRRRGDGLSVLSAMNIDNGLHLVFELLERANTPHLPPEAKYEAFFLKVPLG